MSTTAVEFICKGHCYPLGICQYAELEFKNGKLLFVKCRLPKKITDNTLILTT